MIPFVDLTAQYRSIRGEIDAAISRVIGEAAFVGGPEVKKFGEEFGAFCGAHAVGVANGTDAIHLAARALGLGPGDEVIVPSHTFIATAEGVAQTGARVVFADIDEETYTLDPADAEARITERTRAVVAVHLYGQPADLDALGALARRHNLFLIEDAAQAHGARFRGCAVGAIGDAGTFSFYPSKNLGAYGDAGAVVSRDAELVRRVARLADHGSVTKYEHETEGINSRLDGLQAAVLRAKLPHLDDWTRRRQQVAALYKELLADFPEVCTPVIAEGRTHVFHLFVIEVDGRDALQEHLRARGVATGIHYPIPVHRQPAYRHLGYPAGSLPRTERAAARVLSLPIFPELTPGQVEEVVEAVASFLGQGRKAH